MSGYNNTTFEIIFAFTYLKIANKFLSHMYFCQFIISRCCHCDQTKASVCVVHEKNTKKSPIDFVLVLNKKCRPAFFCQHYKLLRPKSSSETRPSIFNRLETSFIDEERQKMIKKILLYNIHKYNQNYSTYTHTIYKAIEAFWDKDHNIERL